VTMTDLCLKEALQGCLDIINSKSSFASKQIATKQNKLIGRGIEFPEAIAHIKFLCLEGLKMPSDKREKAMRWLAFVQGTLWSVGWASIETLKKTGTTKGGEPERVSAVDLALHSEPASSSDDFESTGVLY